MFNFRKVQEKEVKKGQFIRPGVQNLILKNITLEESKNTGNVRPVFFMETEPITDPGWEPHADSQHGGQIGKVAGNGGYYLKNETQQDEFLSFLKSIMKAVGTLDDFMASSDNTDYNDLKEVIEGVKPYLVGKTARYFVSGEQYQKLDNSGVGLRLKFPNRRAVEAVSVTETTLPKYDETNPAHFKRLPREERSEPISDLPF